ncbi:MAG: hypothetical protein E7315_00455 [Clostridiales bacterium]|nr:hypothetical protein [Clostridiales bacterium]
MKRVARAAKEKELKVEYLHCSSDPFSLDGILVDNGRFAMVDGTSPHIIEPKYPGAAEAVINLSEFWDVTELKRRKNSIMETDINIKYEFARAYKYLAAAKDVISINNEIYESNLCEDALEDMSEELAGDILRKTNKTGGKGRSRCSFASGITPSGLMNYIASLSQGYERVYALTGYGGYKMLQKISYLMERNGVYCEKYYCPMFPDEKIEHLFIPSAGVAFLTHNRHHGVHLISNDVIDLTEYSDITRVALSAQILSENERMYEKLLEMAVTSLKDAYWLHNTLESYYIPAMNFSALDNHCTRFISDILN